MKYNLALLFIVFFIKISAQNTTPDYFVSDISQTDKIGISTTDLNKLAKEYGETTNFTELKVQKVSDHFILLAKDIAQKWIYAFELKSIDTKLFINMEKHINACQSDNLSISIFNIVDGQIDGCIKVNHRVLGRN